MLFRSLLHSKIIDDDQIGFEISSQRAVLLGWGFIGLKFSHQIKDRSVEDQKTRLDSVITEGLHQMALTHPGRPHHEQIPVLTDEIACRQLVELLTFDARVKAPIKLLERFCIPEAGPFLSLLDESLLPNVEFVLKHQFQELSVRQLMSGRLVKANLQAAEETGQTESAGGLNECVIHGIVFG